MDEKQKHQLEHVLREFRANEAADWRKLDEEQREAARRAEEQRLAHERLAHHQNKGTDEVDAAIHEINERIGHQSAKLLRVSLSQGARSIARTLPEGGYEGGKTLTLEWQADYRVHVTEPGKVPPDHNLEWIEPVAIADAPFDQADKGWIIDQIIAWLGRLASAEERQS